MAPCVRFTIVTVAVMATMRCASAGEPTVRKPPTQIHISTATSDEWLLGLIDGAVAFHGRWHGDEDDKKFPLIPSDLGQARTSFTFLRDGDTLQVVVRDTQKLVKSQTEKDYWYLSARYTEKGGTVALTKQLEKYSHWEFVSVEGRGDREVKYYYLRNINDVGKDAWLGIEATGVRYRWHREVRKPKLSFAEKQVFGVEDAHSGK